MGVTVVTATTPSPVLTLRGVARHYGGVKALAGVDLDVYPGRVHAIVGENGAGKSTLMKILAGAERPDAGRMVLRGEEVWFRDVGQANAHGIAIVFQELSLFPHLDVLSNLFMLREPTRMGLLTRGAMERGARPVLDELGLNVPLTALVGRLTLGEQQLVEIGKALLADASVLILDEPNSALNAEESRRLFQLIRGLRARGVAILFISHRLEEVFEIADLITVMRNGLVIETVDRSTTSIPAVIASMLGREFTEAPARLTAAPGQDASLRMEAISVKRKLEHVDLTVSPGEIVGLAGLEGSGVSTVLEVVFGQQRPDAGSVTLPDGRPGPHGVPEAVRAGVALIPADRREEGLMLGADVMSNMSVVTAGALGLFGWMIDFGRMAQRAKARGMELSIIAGSMRSPVSSLSGGNQQKVVIAKWLEAAPRIVLLNDPTRGVDVGAKEEIHRIIDRLAADDRVVLFTSSELSEYARLCDRVVVFYRGRICGEIPQHRLSEHLLLEAINTGVIRDRAAVAEADLRGG